MKEIRCSFCESENDATKIVNGPVVYICYKCAVQVLSLAMNHAEGEQCVPFTLEQGKLAYCAFCGKSQDEVKSLVIKNGSVSICNECIYLCIEHFFSKSNLVALVQFKLDASLMKRTQNVDL